MERITQKDLDILVQRINEATGNPVSSYRRVNDKLVGNPCNYHLDYAYGGVKLVQMCSDGHGCSNISTDGFGTKRQLYSWMRAYLSGLTN